MKGRLALLLFLALQVAVFGQEARLIDTNHPAFDPVQTPPTRVSPPKPIFDVRTYGAVGDGTTFDTAAIQKAIDACAGSGGTVYLAAGKFLTAPLELKGKMTFYVNADASLLGSTRPEDYPDKMPPTTAAAGLRKSLIYAYAADGLILDGTGEINGQGQLLQMNGKESFRPSLLRIFGSKDITVRNLTLRNPRMWTDIYCECSHLTLDHLNIFSPRGYCENLDGMDICDCDHVTISNCHIEAQDDGICLKSHSVRGLHDISVFNNTIIDFDANAIKIGTATKGPIERLSFANNTIKGARYGGLCIESVDGSKVNDIHVNGLEMSHVSQPLFIRLARRDTGNNGKPATTPGSIDHVLIENVRVMNPGTSTLPSNTITGIPQAPLGSIVLRNAYIEMPGGQTQVPQISGEKDGTYPQSNIFGLTPASGIYVRHAPNVTLDYVSLQSTNPDVRPWLATDEATVNTLACTPLTK